MKIELRLRIINNENSDIIFNDNYSVSALFAQDKGRITGSVTDKETQSPISEAACPVANTDFKTVTNSEGKFEFTNIPLGNYEIKVSGLGYETFVQTDVVVLSSRPANVEIELLISNITTEQIDVEGKYFQKSDRCKHKQL